MHFLEKLSQEFKKESTVLSVKSRSRMLSGKTWRKFNLFYCAKYRNCTVFSGVEFLWKGIVST